MKRLLPLLAMIVLVLSAISVNAQSQRMTLAEEFTNASCAPCASANPTFNALLTTNASKVIAIKYQTNWPGTDPMNAQNPSEVATRVAYYGVTGVPHVLGDGNFFDDHPANYTQTILNNAYAVASPFDMAISHSLSADFDSIFVTVIITCSQAVSGTLVAHTVIEENEIHFTTAPGSNGETVFYDVMRKMLPDQNGTTLATSWTVGMVDTLTFAVPLPSYIYDINQICVVAFIQDNANKNVKQAVRSAPITQSGDANLDAGISALSNVPIMTCDSTFVPTATLKNYKSTVLTTANINWQLDNGTIGTQPWTGSLALNATSSITLPTISVTSGSHSFRVWVSDPNGGADFYPSNNTQTKTVNVSTTTSFIPVTEGFEGTFPPAGWIINNPDNGYTWRQYSAGGFGTSSKSAMIPFYSITSGTDDLILPAYDMTADTAAILTFDVAHALYSTSYADQLKVMVSTNCGTTWTQVYSKSGSTLATAPTTTGYFVPTATQWRTETVDLSSYIGNAKVFVKFVGVSDYGNNCYVDNINITQQSSSGIDAAQVAESAVQVYPNPFTNLANIELVLGESSNVSVTVYNTLGMLVQTENAGELAAGAHHFEFSGTDHPAGVYFISVQLNDQVITKRVNLVK